MITANTVFRALERNKKMRVTLHIQLLIGHSVKDNCIWVQDETLWSSLSLDAWGPAFLSCYHNVKNRKHLHWTCDCSSHQYSLKLAIAGTHTTLVLCRVAQASWRGGKGCAVYRQRLEYLQWVLLSMPGRVLLLRRSGGTPKRLEDLETQWPAQQVTKYITFNIYSALSSPIQNQNWWSSPTGEMAVRAIC